MVESKIGVLAERAGDLARVGNEPSRHTVASYERRWRQWQQFADHFGISALPADPMHVAAFVVARAKAGVSPSGIAANLSAVGWFHARLDPPQPEVTQASRTVLRNLERRGPAPGLSPAPVLSVGALAALAAVPARLTATRSTALVRAVSGVAPRQLMLLRAEDVSFGPGGAWVDLALRAAPMAVKHPGLPARVVRLWACRSILECPVEAMRVLVAGSPTGPLVTGSSLYRRFGSFGEAATVPLRISARNRALVAVGYAGALRIEELSTARVEHLEPVGDGYRLVLPRTKTSRNGRSEAVVVMPEGAPFDPVRLLDRWLELRGDHDGPLFHNVHHHTDLDRGMTPGEIRDAIRDLAVAVGLPKTVSGYSLRRSWATHTYLRDRNAVGRIMLQLRHERISTTVRYIEDLECHVLNPEEFLSPETVATGPGGVSTPAKDLGFAYEPLDTLVGEAIGSLRVSAGHSPGTLRQVTSYWRRWESWAEAQGLSSFPADPAHVLLFVAARAEEGAAPNTLRAHLRAIQQVHDEAGVATVGFLRLAADVVAGVERNRVAPRKRAPVLAIPDLERMAKLALGTGESDLAGLRDWLMLVVGYTAGLRVQDLHLARLEHLERTSAGYVMRLAGRGLGAVLLAARDDALDPVAAIEVWRERTGLRAGPLLPVVPLRQPSRPMSKDAIVERLQRLAARAGCTVRPTGESLRRSWATHAYEAGLDLLSISRHLRQRHYDTGRGLGASLSPWPGNPASRLNADGGTGE